MYTIHLIHDERTEIKPTIVQIIRKGRYVQSKAVQLKKKRKRNHLSCGLYFKNFIKKS